MAGFKFMPRFEGASLGEKLEALAGALGGDMGASSALRQRLERERMARQLAAMFSPAEQAEAVAAESEAPPPPEPAKPPPLAQAAADVTARLQDESLGPVGAPEPRPALEVPDLSGVPLREAGGRRPGPRFRDALPVLMEAAGKGIDAQGMANLIRDEEYLSGLPENVQPRARLDPRGYAARQDELDVPLLNEISPGATLEVTDRRTGLPRSSRTAPARPEPVTIERVIGAVLAKAAQGAELTPQEQQIYDRWRNGVPDEERPVRPSLSAVHGAIAEKMARGEPLTPGEQKVWEDRSRGGDALAALLGGAGLADDEIPMRAAPAGGAPARPAAPARPRAAPPPPRKAASQPPPAAVAKLKEGVITRFANGQQWTLRGGKPVQVGGGTPARGQ